ncbi:MerR family transcriptional regulator [Microbacterium sp. zg.Y1084]|uniref:MerR family transcriptional regulator n=1 Tax=Microbacterium sp. zg.Y1084 TaxID=2969667 RepID=UPI00214B2095|nr:MerR family transcriptional regulator [Microbacterium sp. zg.Y1084]MCR2811746.1 MerR family transcriptional regulator [Microbacterium sp. zg.Y1084]
MPWSTSELGHIAGTTVNTIRHYHRVGLLEQPERTHNGYKQYDVQHLVRLLRIRRLVALGLALSQIPAVSAGEETSTESLRELDAELQASIERLEQARASIAAILRDKAPADAPAGFESVASRVSETDRSVPHLYTRLLDEDALDDVRKMVEDDPDDLSAALEQLPADADERARDALVARYAEVFTQNFHDYPWLRELPSAGLTRRGAVVAQALGEAVPELYNPAQLDVLQRGAVLAMGRVLAVPEDRSGATERAG